MMGIIAGVIAVCCFVAAWWMEEGPARWRSLIVAMFCAVLLGMAIAA